MIEKIDKIFLNRKFNFIFRLLQVSVIGLIMISEIVQYVYYTTFFVDILNWSKFDYFNYGTQDIFGLKGYYAFVIAFTWIDAALYIGLFDKFWKNSDSNKLNMISDLSFTVMWLSVGLTNLIPFYKVTSKWNCPNYKLYRIEGIEDSFYFINLCRTYFIGMSLSWFMVFLFGVSSLSSWRSYRKTKDSK